MDETSPRPLDSIRRMSDTVRSQCLVTIPAQQEISHSVSASSVPRHHRTTPHPHAEPDVVPSVTQCHEVIASHMDSQISESSSMISMHGLRLEDRLATVNSFSISTSALQSG